MTPTLSALLRHIEECRECTRTKRCAHANRMQAAWQDAMVARMEPRSAVKA